MKFLKIKSTRLVYSIRSRFNLSDGDLSDMDLRSLTYKAAIRALKEKQHDVQNAQVIGGRVTRGRRSILVTIRLRIKPRPIHLRNVGEHD